MINVRYIDAKPKILLYAESIVFPPDKSTS